MNSRIPIYIRGPRRFRLVLAHAKGYSFGVLVIPAMGEPVYLPNDAGLAAFSQKHVRQRLFRPPLPIHQGPTLTLSG